MRSLVLTLLVGLTAACTTTTAYWTRPGATLPQVVQESGECYRSSLAEESPSALPSSSPSPGPRLLPRSEPPPALWRRAPSQAGLERFDEQLRYEACMRALGWTASGSAPLRSGGIPPGPLTR
jgi:hypothetical protein